MKRLLTLITVVGLVTIGCNDRHESASSQQSSSVSPSPQKPPMQQAPTIPSDVSYSIINSQVMPGVKRMLDVRLNKKVSEATLRTIALNLKTQDTRDYPRTFMMYYLPGMTIGAGAWATSHFNPDLDVRILGLTADEGKKLVTEPAVPNREILGRWLDQRPFVSSSITIFKEGEKLFSEQKFKDGSSLKKEIVEKPSPLGRRFDEAEGSSHGDYWLLEPSGNLQICDNDGLITTTKKAN